MAENEKGVTDQLDADVGVCKCRAGRAPATWYEVAVQP
jgi:hypothetical protein